MSVNRKSKPIGTDTCHSTTDLPPSVYIHISYRCHHCSSFCVSLTSHHSPDIQSTALTFTTGVGFDWNARRNRYDDVGLHANVDVWVRREMTVRWGSNNTSAEVKKYKKIRYIRWVSILWREVENLPHTSMCHTHRYLLAGALSPVNQIGLYNGYGQLVIRQEVKIRYIRWGVDHMTRNKNTLQTLRRRSNDEKWKCTTYVEV